MHTELENASLVSGILIAFATLLFLLERLYPLRSRTHSLFTRLAINLALSAIAFGAASLVVRPAIMKGLGWSENYEIGILYLLPQSFPLRLCVGFLLLDASFYLWHRANHHIPFLWRFHNVHHVDPDLDVSTAFRFHFGEIALSALFRVIQIIVVGPSILVFAVYDLLFHANTLFHHCNILLPVRIERVLNWFLVTPRMHGIHHSSIKEEAFSNFSVVIPWWDRVAKTLLLNIPQSEIKVGVPGYSDAESNTIFGTITLPFRKQRDYWIGKDGPMLKRPKCSDSAPKVLAE